MASSFSKKGIREAATETNCFGDTSTYSTKSDFDKIKFVGTLRKEGTTVALVQTDGQRGHTVKVGTLIGPNLGVVKTVDEKKIVILERYRNYLGEILSQLRNIEFKKNQLQG